MIGASRILIDHGVTNSPVRLIDAIASSTNENIAFKNKLTINDPIMHVPRSLILIYDIFSIFNFIFIFYILNGIFFLVVYCSGLQITIKDFSVEPTTIAIKFNNIPGLDHSADFMGYAILFKMTDAEEWWQVRYKRGGWGRSYIFEELRPYVNYTFRVSPYALKAGGLAGPPLTIQTKEDSK